MPNLVLHVGIAKEVFNRLPHPVLREHYGTFLLGSTAPDIRIITRSTRDDTHFAPLGTPKAGDGVRGLFQAYPSLSSAALAGPATAAFIAGYISHIVADEVWVIDIYTPFFGNRKVFEDGVLANILDRALQIELDMREKSSWNGVESVAAHIRESGKGVSVPFIAADTLAQWKEWVLGALNREQTWTRLRFFVDRMFRERNPLAEEHLIRILSSAEDSLAEIFSRVPQARVDAFREHSIAKVVALVQEHLD